MKRRKLSNIFVIIMGMLLFFTSQVNSAPAETKRLWGSDRYQTCSEIVNEGWKSCNYAVIVNGENFPDALSASTLAKKYNAPILLTQDKTLDNNTRYQLKRLGVKKVFIVGGSFVVKDSVENELHSMGVDTERFFGADRNETSIEVAKQIGTDNGIILTIDSDFTDALSVAPIAAKLQIPIILMPKNSIPASISNFIAGKNISKTYVLGGQDLISDSVASKFSNVQRISGNDKYERNINIINTFADKFSFDNIYFAYSEKFADALSGSALAALNANPIILMGDFPTNLTGKFVQSKINEIKRINILGGTAGIKDNEIDILINNNAADLNTLYFDIQQQKASNLITNRKYKEAAECYASCGKQNIDISTNRDYIDCLSKYAETELLKIENIHTDDLSTYYAIGDLDNDSILELAVYEKNYSALSESYVPNKINLYKFTNDHYDLFASAPTCSDYCMRIFIGKAIKDQTAVFLSSSAGAHAGYQGIYILRDGKFIPGIDNEIYSLYPSHIEDIDSDGIFELSSLLRDPNDPDSSNAACAKITTWYKWNDINDLKVIDTNE